MALGSPHADATALGSWLEHVFEPVPHVMHADRDVVDLTMMEAALVALEDLERLVLRADRGEAFFRKREWNLFVAGAVQEEKRTTHLLHDSIEPESFELLERRGCARRAEHPLQMLRRACNRRHPSRG